jgi:hypothetical protein
MPSFWRRLASPATASSQSTGSVAVVVVMVVSKGGRNTSRSELESEHVSFLVNRAASRPCSNCLLALLHYGRHTKFQRVRVQPDAIKSSQETETHGEEGTCTQPYGSPSGVVRVGHPRFPRSALFPPTRGPRAITASPFAHTVKVGSCLVRHRILTKAPPPPQMLMVCSGPKPSRGCGPRARPTASTSVAFTSLL